MYNIEVERERRRERGLVNLCLVGLQRSSHDFTFSAAISGSDDGDNDDGQDITRPKPACAERILLHW